MAGRSAAAQPEKKPDLPDGQNIPVDNSGIEIEREAEPEIEVSVEGQDEPVVEKGEPPTEPQSTSALQKQLDELRRSEQLSRTNHEQMVRERDEAIARSQKFERESVQSRQDSEQSQLDAINNAMVAAKAESESAERELEQAISNADTKAQAEAYRKMARAETSHGRLEDGKSELEYRLKLAQNQREQHKAQEEIRKQAPSAQQQGDPIEGSNVPERAKEWMREHRDYINSDVKVAKLNLAHEQAKEAGFKEFSTAYFIEIEKNLGINQQPEPQSEPERAAQEPKRTPIVSAPVSREAPSGGSSTSPTRIRLTKDQSELAKLAGITEAEYAKQLMKLNEYKKNGSYGDGR